MNEKKIQEALIILHDTQALVSNSVTNIGREIADVREIASFSAWRFFLKKSLKKSGRFFPDFLPIFVRFFSDLSRDIADFFEAIFSRYIADFFPIYPEIFPIFSRFFLTLKLNIFVFF